MSRESQSRELESPLKTAMIRTGLIRPVYRLREWWRSRGAAKSAQSADGLSLPPRYLMQMVVSSADPDAFLISGRRDVASFAALFTTAGIDFANARRLLDFGCGCGRLARHLPAFTSAQIAGVDYNPRLVRWCAANLPGDYHRNQLAPPLDFSAGRFDVLYALSVFTHLRRATQEQWLVEIERVLAPGGAALITFHDEYHAGLTPDLRVRLAQDGFAIANDAIEGSNLIASFQTWETARAMFGRRFDILLERRSDETPFRQAALVVRKRAA
jgi:SAM-dependent methyltransferase